MDKEREMPQELGHDIAPFHVCELVEQHALPLPLTPGSPIRRNDEPRAENANNRRNTG
jgi:hypothetical protein